MAKNLSGRAIIFVGIGIIATMIGVFGMNFTRPDIVYATVTHPKFQNGNADCPDGFLPRKNTVERDWNLNSPTANTYEPFTDTEYYVNLEYKVTYKFCAEIYDIPSRRGQMVWMLFGPLNDANVFPPTCGEDTCHTQSILISPSGLRYVGGYSKNNTIYVQFEPGIWKIHIQALFDPTYSYRWYFGVYP